jgi:hypothetical protein
LTEFPLKEIRLYGDFASIMVKGMVHDGNHEMICMIGHRNDAGCYIRSSIEWDDFEGYRNEVEANRCLPNLSMTPAVFSTAGHLRLLNGDDVVDWT